jgi:hypothetical protein
LKLLLGLFVGDGIVPLLQRLPKSLLGIMVFAAGVELAKVGQTVNEGRGIWEQAEDDNEGGRPAGKALQSVEEENSHRYMVMLITAAGCLAFKNDAVGFFAGLLWHWGLRAPGLYKKLREGRGSIKLHRDGHHEHGEGLLDLRQDED